MIKQWLRWIGAALAVALAACGGGEGSSGSYPYSGEFSVGQVEAVTLMPGEARSLPVLGGVPPYRVVVDNQAIAEAELKGSELIIGGRHAGETHVTVFDRTGEAVKLKVTVRTSTLFTTAPEDLQLDVNEARTFRIGGGVKPYVITGSDNQVAAVTQLDAEHWRIEGLAIGEMTVRIRDAAGNELFVDVTVKLPKLSISPASLTLPVGSKATVTLSGGQKPYSFAGVIPEPIPGGIPQAIDVRPVPGSDSTFEIIALREMNVKVVFADATGVTVETTVTVNTNTAKIRVSPSEVRVGEQSGTVVTFSVFSTARDGLTTVFSSHPRLVSVSSVTNPVLNPDGTIRTAGSFVATVSDSTCIQGDTEVTLTVLDSDASVGTATVKVVDTNPNCPAN